MKIKALIFDLDDTLYDEIQFVKSGFEATSKYMAENFGIDKDVFYKTLLNIFLNQGRGNTFDTALRNLNIYKKKTVLEMVNVYRNHFPNITLFSGAKEILLQARREYRTALFTGGLKKMQENKVEALKLGKIFDVITYAVEYGGKNIQAFSAVLEKLEAEPSESIYVDNDSRDFAAAKNLGIHTVQIMSSKNKDRKIIDEKCAPQFEISNLKQLLEIACSI